MDLAPLPGDPDTVSREAQKMQAAADRMSAAARILGRIAASEEFTSKATDALEGNAAEMQQVVTHAATRYRGAGEALTVYARVLHEAQLEAERARSAAASTDTALPAARVREARVALMNPLLDEPSRVDLQRDLAHAKASFAQEVAQQRAAMAAYEDARAKVSAAAAVAASRIEDAVRHSGLNDTFWDNARGWSDKYLVPALEAVVTVAEWVSTICTIASIVCAIIPGLQPFAVVFLVAGRVMTGASLAAHGALTLMGEKTWGEMAAASILAVASLVKVKADVTKLNELTGAAFKDALPEAAARISAEGGKFALNQAVEGADGGTIEGRASLNSAKAGSEFIITMTAEGALEDGLKDGLGNVALNMSAAAAGSALDTLFPPESQWSTDDLVTRDASVLGETHTVDLDSLMAASFAVPQEPRIDGRGQLCSTGPGGGISWQ